MSSTSLATPDPLTAAHAAPAVEVAAALGVDPAVGLSTDEVARRRAAHGPNELPEAPRDPAWRRLVRQLRDLLTLILLAAAVVSYLVSGELKTPLVVLVVVIVNAVIGFVQENRAEASLDALRRMLVLEARVRRDGELRTVPAAELVPGDVVAVEAGDRVPADGRLLEAVQLEVEEAALTGESVPAAKAAAPVEGDDVPVADRASMVHMQTTVTRGAASSSSPAPVPPRRSAGWPGCSKRPPTSARRCSASSTTWPTAWPSWPGSSWCWWWPSAWCGASRCRTCCSPPWRWRWRRSRRACRP